MYAAPVAQHAGSCCRQGHRSGTTLVYPHLCDELAGRADRRFKILESLVAGIVEMDKIPDLIFIVDIKNDKTALLEANKRGVPVIAICDTNVNPDKVEYPIPANDDAVKSIEMIVNLVADAVVEGKKSTVKSDVLETK